MLYYIMQGIYYAIPVAAVVFFVVSLVLFLSAKRQESQAPGSVDATRLKTLKFLLIVSSIIAGVLLLVVLAFMALMFMAVAFM